MQKSAVGIGATLAVPHVLNSMSKQEEVNIGFIGTGLRGRNHVNNILQHSGVRCSAICDIDPEAINKTKDIFQQHRKDAPRIYGAHERSFEEMLKNESLDANS